jgi:hypothetical protein
MPYVYGWRFALPAPTPKPCPRLFPCHRQTLAKIAPLRLVMRMSCSHHLRRMLCQLRYIDQHKRFGLSKLHLLLANLLALLITQNVTFYPLAVCFLRLIFP